MKKRNPIQSMPENDRPYEKCLLYGPDKLADYELLAVLLRSGTSGFSVLDTAKEILSRARGTSGLLALHQLSFSELMQIPGVGKVKAMQIKCLSEICKRMASESVREDVTYDCPASIARYYMEKLRHETIEQVCLLGFDSKDHLLSEQCISKGTVDHSLISPREIFIQALCDQAVNLVLLHNHPSGDPTPSEADFLMTERIHTSAGLLGLRLMDHIIIGDQKYFSFSENGYITEL